MNPAPPVTSTAPLPVASLASLRKATVPTSNPLDDRGRDQADIAEQSLPINTRLSQISKPLHQRCGCGFRKQHQGSAIFRRDHVGGNAFERGDIHRIPVAKVSVERHAESDEASAPA